MCAIATQAERISANLKKKTFSDLCCMPNYSNSKKPFKKKAIKKDKTIINCGKYV